MIREPDKSIYNAMNKGILKSNGQYLHYFNSGKWLIVNNIFEMLFK